MLNLKNYSGFAVELFDYSLERNRLYMYCLKNNIKFLIIKNKEKCPIDYVPCGSVEWCSRSFIHPIIPDYYPEWTKECLYRKIWRQDSWILGRKLFVKPADRYKRFDGFVTSGTYKKKKKPPLIWSEIVEFENEWRYYISHGKILASEWYCGDEVNTPEASELKIDIPANYYGALDVGSLKDGRLAIVESQHPFACGWYGPIEKDVLYFQWLIDGWDYMMKNVNHKPKN